MFFFLAFSNTKNQNNNLNTSNMKGLINGKLMIFSFEDVLVSRLCISVVIAQISNKSYLIGTHKLLLPLCSGFQ